MANRPGGELARRPLHFLWILDCSKSMEGKKIESLNFAIRESIPEMQKAADENPNAQMLVRAIRFSDCAQWHLSQPTDVHDFKWTDLNADGVTFMGAALSLAAEALKVENMPPRGLPPVLVLITDGHPTDDFNAGFKALMDQPWGSKSVRVGIAIGDDADLDVLQKFIGDPERKPLVATNAPTLVRQIKYASTMVPAAAAKPPSQVKGQATAANVVPMPVPPTYTGPVAPGDVF